jgi:hypothetical protein
VVGPWPHPGIPYPTWSLHKAESRLRHPNQSFASRVGQARGRFVLSAMTLRTLRTILILALGTSFLKTPEALQYSETAVDSAIPGPGVRKRLMIKPGYGATFRAEGSTHTGWGTARSAYTAIGATTSLGCLTIRRGREPVLGSEGGGGALDRCRYATHPTECRHLDQEAEATAHNTSSTDPITARRLPRDSTNACRSRLIVGLPPL